MIDWKRIDLRGTEGVDLTIENLKMLYELEDIEERVIDANCNLLSRIIDYCKKNSIPFDNALIVLMHEARKALKTPTLETPEQVQQPLIIRNSTASHNHSKIQQNHDVR
ncbi:MAG: hypothetical protein JRN20_01350 [Nitrososphaerota archaeon]|nr:hypothetical protein [Nitrososphaerota archaeon]